jgi:hypothetical protein
MVKVDEYRLQVNKTSLPLVLTNGIKSSSKRASAQIRLYNWAKAKTFQLFYRWLKPTAMNISCSLRVSLAEDPEGKSGLKEKAGR